MKEVNPETITLPPDLQGRHFFTPDEFGSLCGKSSGTIRRWAKLGLLKIRQFTPRCNLIPASELERLKTGNLMEANENK